MPAITFSDFSGGLDRRLPITVQDASRLWILREAYVTTGKRIAKRPGLRKIASTLTGTVGLASVNGRLKVFANVGDVVPGAPQVDVLLLSVPAGLTTGQHLQRIYAAEIFNGYVYAVAEYDPSGVYVGGVTEGNTGGDTGGDIPPPKPPTPGSPINAGLGALRAEGDTTPHTVASYAGVRFHTDGQIYLKEGGVATAYVASGSVWWTGAPGSVPTAGYSVAIVRVSAVRASGPGTYSGAGSFTSALQAANVDVEAHVTNAVYTISYTYSINDGAGSPVSTGTLTLRLESTD